MNITVTSAIARILIVSLKICSPRWTGPESSCEFYLGLYRKEYLARKRLKETVELRVKSARNLFISRCFSVLAITIVSSTSFSLISVLFGFVPEDDLVSGWVIPSTQGYPSRAAVVKHPITLRTSIRHARTYITRSLSGKIIPVAVPSRGEKFFRV